MEVLIGVAAVLGLLVVSLLVMILMSPNRPRNPDKPVPKPSRPKLYRPVKRYKSKLRGVGVSKKVVSYETVDENGNPMTAYAGVDRKNYVRFYPNFGFTVRGVHWCRKGKH